ncbi:MAG: GNAT family N-acetyltransferase [Thermoanaerobaculia bacterium]
MKGLRLFVRPLTTSDLPVVREILDQAGVALPKDAPSEGLVAKLLGDPVAVVLTRPVPPGALIELFLVAPRLRRKHIGRTLLRELLLLTPGGLAVRRDDKTDRFFRNAGFRDADGALLISEGGTSRT